MGGWCGDNYLDVEGILFSVRVDWCYAPDGGDSGHLGAGCCHPHVLAREGNGRHWGNIIFDVLARHFQAVR